MKQVRDCHKDKENCHCDSLRRQIKLLKINEKKLMTEVAKEVWTRDEQVHAFRAGLRLQALHSEDVTQEYAGLHQHLT